MPSLLAGSEANLHSIPTSATDREKHTLPPTMMCGESIYAVRPRWGDYVHGDSARADVLHVHQSDAVANKQCAVCVCQGRDMRQWKQRGS